VFNFLTRIALPRRGIAVVGSAVAVVALASAPSPAVATTSRAPQMRHACAAVSGRVARCMAEYTVAARTAATPAAVHAVTPADIRAAYNLPSNAGAGMTVGIVDAYDNPKAVADLAKFRARYHLPPCTTANGCVRKVNQQGKTKPLPPRDAGWGLEISLDLDAVSAACPQCHILLVESRSADLRDLGIAVNTAVRLGADVVSNSYGAQEFGGMRGFGLKYYRHPGVPIVASTGDFGFGPASFPAVLGVVIAVGGTTLTRASGTARGWTERAWAGASSGCSAYIPKPAWQSDTHCLMRTVADVSAVADPATGLLVSDSFGFPGTVRVGGTSLSSPLIAAMIAMAGNATTINNAAGIYAHASDLNDVVGGSNGFCGRDYLCTGRPGYDAPTGMGTPNGLGAL
jgi:subtilase family serine protease